jgi:hypothetical protein
MAKSRTVRTPKVYAGLVREHVQRPEELVIDRQVDHVPRIARLTARLSKLCRAAVGHRGRRVLAESAVRTALESGLPQADLICALLDAAKACVTTEQRRLPRIRGRRAVSSGRPHHGRR